MDIHNESRRLWHDVFGDPTAWIDMYMAAYGGDDRLLYRTDADGRRIISQLVLAQYGFRYQGCDLTAAYIAGAATARAERGRGLMHGLLDEALKTAHARGDALCMVIPGGSNLSHNYEHMGFAAVFYVDRERYTSLHRWTADPAYSITFVSPDSDPERIGRAYNRLTIERACMVTHRPDEFASIIADINGHGGVVALAHDHNGDIVGISFAVVCDGQLTVREMAAANGEVRDSLMAALKTRFPSLPCSITTMPDRRRAPVEPHAMARITDVSAMLAAYASANPDTRLRIRVSDPVIADNNGIFNISRGRLSINRDITSASDSDIRTDLDVTVSTLTSILFSGPRIGHIFDMATVRPHMSLMLG